MSLSRAFTTKRARGERPEGGFLGRTFSTRAPKSNVRGQISAPVALVSSTNTQLYDTPDIFGTTPIPNNIQPRAISSSHSVSSSRSSTGDSDGGSSIGRYSRDTSTDASSVDMPSPEPNHLSCYFKPAAYVDTTMSRSSSVRSYNQSPIDAPVIPQRAPSHSKRAHVQLSRQRSVSRLQSPPSTAHEFAARDENPFGKELAQLNEIAEEFGSFVRDAEAEADLAFMQAHGLGHYGADDYMMEIQDMLHTVFEEEYPAYEQTSWI